MLLRELTTCALLMPDAIYKILQIQYIAGTA